ncbi:MAG: Histidine kinase [Mucilaginibacter sp.]|nr:Histidine kinase [Mucilaginibacter sp.]
MSVLEPSIFELIFKQSLVPAIILEANAPAFTVIAQNREHQLAMHAAEIDMAGKSAYELLVADITDVELLASYAELVKAFKQAIEQKVIVKLPAIKSLVKDPDGLHIHSVWQQMEVVPVVDKSGHVKYLICSTYDIAKQAWLEAARKDGLSKESDLTEELAASNEELSATNEELSASNEELRQSQESLAESNRELESRVEQRAHALAESEARFRAMVEQSPVPMLVTMGDAMIFDIINQPMLDLIGKDASVVGRPWHEAMPELEGQDIIRQLLETYDAGVSWEGNEVPIMIYKSGTSVLGFYNITYKPLTENGKTIGMLQSAIDVTGLVKSRLMVEELNREQQTANEELAATNEELAATNEELHTTNDELTQTQERLQNLVVELAESEDRFRNMAESTEVLIAVADESGNGIYFNKAWSNLTGKPEEELLAFNWAELIHPDDKEQWISNYLEAAGRQAAVNGEFRILDKNGDFRWLLASIPARFRPDGSFAGYVSSCIDITDRKNYEQQLEQIINILPASVVVIKGKDLIAESINNANLIYWNKTKEEVVGKPLLEILPELASQAFPGQLRQVMATGEIIDVKESPVLFTGADGTQRETFVDYTYQPLMESNGHYSRVLVMSFEITDRVLSRKLLEQYSEEMQALNEELTASNEELSAVNEELLTAQQSIEEGRIALRLAIDAAEFGTWFIHSVTREFITDARLKELFGYYPDEELSIEQALAQITDEYRGFVATTLENAIYHNGDYDVTYPVIGLHDQQLRWLRAIGNLKADPSGAFSAFTGVVMDITEQILASEKIKNAEETLRMAIASGELATWRLDENLGKITASPRFNELFGFLPNEEVPYTAAVTQILPDYQKMVQDAVTSAFTSSAHFNVEYPITGFHDGKQRWIRSVGKFVADEKNGNYITGVMADITEQKTDEIRKNDFIGMVSHELKTPLTSLNGYLQLLQLRLKKAEDTFTIGALDHSVKQVKRMTTMINGFLNVSRLESGKIYIEKKRFDMADLIKEMAEETETLYSGYQFIFHPVEPTVVNADQDKIGQVINNFISNAVKYSNAETTIQIACVQLNGFTRVSVSDEGMGIDKSDISRLFERYYRVNNNNHISGFGIGLYLSAEIIERHQGKIWAESEPGKGSTFYFSLPLASDQIPQ